MIKHRIGILAAVLAGLLVCSALLAIPATPLDQTDDAQVQFSRRGGAMIAATSVISATQPADTAEIDRLIKQLGSETYAEREEAQKALLAIGDPAVAALREAASDKDAERANRARMAWTQIEEHNLRAHRQGSTLVLGHDATDDDLAWLRNAREITELRMGGGLNPSGPFITDDGLANIVGWTDLKVLQIYCVDSGPAGNKRGPRITDAGLQHLAGLNKLEKLTLYDQRITDAGLVHLAGLTNLQELDLSYTPLTGAGTAHLRGLTKLKSLRLYKAALDDDAVANFSEMTQLEDLQIGDARITDKGLRTIAALKKLQTLDLQGTLITDEGVARLGGLSQLMWLCLENTAISDAGLANLKSLSNLDWLTLDQTKVTGAGLKHLAALPNLEVLYLSQTEVGDEGLESLAALRKLASLQLTGTKLTDAGLAKLHSLTRLKKLEVRKTQVTAEGIRKLQASLPDLAVMADGRGQPAVRPPRNQGTWLSFYSLNSRGVGTWSYVRIVTSWNAADPIYSQSPRGFFAMDEGRAAFTGFFRARENDKVVLVASADLLASALAEIPAAQKVVIPRDAIESIDVVPATQPATQPTK